MLQGFDGVVWMVVLLNSCGGLLVAAVMKYADNIVKCFAAALAILSGTLISVPPSHSHPSPEPRTPTPTPTPTPTRTYPIHSAALFDEFAAELADLKVRLKQG